MNLRLLLDNRKWLGISLLLMIACLLGACVSAPPSMVAELQVETPEAWAGESVTGDFEAQHWMADFNDPMLVDIVREALGSNYDLQAAASRLDALTAGSIASGSSLWPSLNTTASGNENRRNPQSTGTQQTPTSQTFGLNARFNWEIDLWGKVRNGYKGDLADIQASQADYAATRLSIAGRTAKAWYAAIEASQQYELAKQTLEAIEASSEIVEENFKRGIARALDVRLVRANVASNGSALESRLRSRDAAVRNLEVLLGRYPAKELEIAVALPEISGGVPVGLPSELLLRRPDVIAVERRLAAAEQRKFESSKARIPSISLTASRGTSSSDLDGILDIMERRVWGRSIEIMQPLFQGRRLKFNYKRAKALHEQALSNYSSTVLSAFREVENALTNQSSFSRDYELQKVSAAESVEAEQLAWEQYSRGLTDITTALDAVRRSITARRSLIQVSNQRIQSRIDLYLALGGGFEIEDLNEN